ncbi:MAG: hypothetical protein R3B40_16455 [Polyangiales bacterium]|nr:hypothetical protein [Sandaracinaceae bacterium]
MGSAEQEQLDRTVREACAQSGLRSDSAFLVKNLMRRDPATWPVCCGSGCNPCTENLVMAAVAAKRMLTEVAESEQTAAESVPAKVATVG